MATPLTSMSRVEDATPLPWQHAVAAALLAGGVETAVYVPDSRLRGVITALRAEGLPVLALTREEECVAYAVGFGAAGGHAAVLMQCSGLGNSLNALGCFGPYGVGVPLVLAMRGTLGEGNPVQVPMGRATKPLLDALGIQYFSVERPSDAGTRTSGMLELAYATGMSAAVILEADLGGQRERG